MLFKDSAKLKLYSEFTSAINFASLQATIRFVEQNHIVPILGNELYSSLNTAYALISNETSLSEAHQNLLEECRKVIGPYLAYYYAPKSDVKLSDAGMQRMESATNKTAFQYQGTNFRNANLMEAELQSEALLAFLEENSSAYNEWISSAAFKRYRSLFIKTGSEFNELFTSHSPHRNYWAMRSKMYDVEQLHIKKAIGADLFKTLKEKDGVAEPNFNQYESELMGMLKKAIAYLTVSFAVPFIAVRVDVNGLTVSMAGATLSNDELSKRQNAELSQISLLIKDAAEAGAAWLSEAIKYLTDNAAQFNYWEDPAKVSDDTAYQCNNDDLKGSFGMI